MKRFSKLQVVLGLAVALGGCANPVDPPLIFVQTESAGINIGGSTVDQTFNFTIGYDGRDYALMPAVYEHEAGKKQQVTSNLPGEFGAVDALSVLGNFSLNAGTGEGQAAALKPSAGLGKFFATGSAAILLADGFRRKLAGEGAPVQESMGEIDQAPNIAEVFKEVDELRSPQATEN
jgi:hypothetical protein